MVVAEILGVVNEVTPVPPVKTVPPVAAAYQSMVSPVPAVDVIVTVPVPQRDWFPAVGAVGKELTVTRLVLAVAVQPKELVAVTV